MPVLGAERAAVCVPTTDLHQVDLVVVSTWRTSSPVHQIFETAILMKCSAP